MPPSRSPRTPTSIRPRKPTIAIQSLLSIDGLRFMFSSFVSNFTGFTVVGVTFVALMGAGVAEAAGLMNALIRLLVKVSPDASWRSSSSSWACSRASPRMPAT